MDFSIIDALYGLHLTSEALSLISFVACYVILLLLWKIWHVKGVYLYSTLAVIIANIQVLKTALFGPSLEQIALGTIIFATSFTATDILTECVSAKEAKQCVKICFMSQIIMMIFMVLTILFPTNGNLLGYDQGGVIANPVQYSLYTLFAPSVRITIASLASYYISQMVDIYVFKFIANLTKNKMVWLRFNVAAFVSGLCDNIIFSLLAWVLLSPNPVGFRTLVVTYIFGTYFARVVAAVCSTPVIYLAKKYHISSSK